MKPERPSKMVFPILILIAVFLGLFIIGGFVNQFLKQTPELNDGIRESSPEEID
ncbi:MAG: hypothetical protein RLZZ171_1276 [Cyanobacteriota bacterium]|jgi:uncharacterized protein YneF (UPF0154 family)